MRLKSLEVYGFKSFADRTKFDFEPGMTCIVGPNGCGKSNVTDALRWVLGEQSAKSLRGDGMTNCIFAGTVRRKALGFAEVIITFDNSDRRLPVDAEDVSIGRRLYRDGNAEYFINRELCRLKDVKDLLMDTGVGTTSYCFIQQGQIDRLLHANPKERRLVFEEAAGISKYRTRKEAALRRLERVEKNLEVLGSVRDEVQKSLQKVNRQAQKARRHARLSAALKEKQVILALGDFRALRAEKAELDAMLVELRRLEGEAAARAESSEGRVLESESGQNDLDERARRADELRAEAQAAAERLEAEAASADSHGADLAARIEAAKAEIADLSQALDDDRAEMRRLETSREEAAREVEADERALETAKAAALEAAKIADEMTEALREWRDLTFAAVQSRSDAANQLTRAESDQRNLTATAERLEKDLARIDAAYKEAHAQADAANTRCGHIMRAMDEQSAAAAQAADEAAGLERRISEIDGEVATMRAEIEARRTRLAFLQELMQKAEGIAVGAREIIRAARSGAADVGRVYGLVADLVKAPPEVEKAIETAMGSLASNVVVDSGQSAAKAIDYLSEGRRGRASFLPLDRMCRTKRIPDELLGHDGVLGRGSDLLTYHEAFRPVFEYLLGRVLVVRDRATALEMATKAGPGTRMVTLDGEIVDGTGPMTGGTLKVERPGLLTRKNEIERMTAELTQGEAALEALIAERAGADVARAEIRRRIEEHNVESRRLDSAYAEAKADHASLRSEEKRLDQQRFATAASFDEARRDLDIVHGKLDGLRARVEELQKEEAAAQAEVDSISGRIDAARAERQKLDKEFADHRASAATLREKLAGLNKAIDGMRRQVEERAASLRARRDELDRTDAKAGELRETARRAKEELAARSADLDRLAREAGELRAERDALRASIDTVRAEARQARAEHSKSQGELTEYRVHENEITMKLEAIEHRARTEYGVSLEERLAMYEQAAAAAAAAPATDAAEDAEGVDAVSQPAEAVASEDAASEAVTQEPASSGEGDEEEDEEGDDIASAEVDYSKGIPEPTPELRAEIDDIIRKLASLGSVNMYALEEAKELGERARFLNEQFSDLTKAQRSLRDVIHRINRKSKVLFQETFDTVRGHFQELFRKLFGGGKADVFLEEGVDVLEAGIEIKARPPGREELPLSALSGGQKAMTTIALLFAIFQTKPSPFCILDEVDAPLDDANVDRYNQILLEYTDRTQFIVITHNKTTMAYAERLYGVTMQEPGVSRKVSIMLKDVDDDLAISDEALARNAA